MRKPLSAAWCLLAGLAAAGLGLLPWLVTGMRLPLQNLWAADTAPEAMPRVLLPFSQYALTLLVGLVVTGAAGAGLFARVVRPRLSGRRFLAVLAGVLAVQVVAVVQTARAVGAGLQDRRESDLYLAALLAGTVATVVVGALVTVLVGRGPRAAAVVGLGAAAVAFGPWLSSLLVPFGSVPSATAPLLSGLVRWLVPLLVGVVIAWGGIRTPGRVAAAVSALALLWVGPAVITAVANAAGSRVLARYPAEMAAYGGEVLVAALTTPALALPPLGFAVAVAVVGLLGRRVVTRRG